MLLYKYRAWNSYSAEILSKRTIFFPSKLKLNDPAELVHPVKFERSTWSEQLQQAKNSVKPSTRILALKISTELLESKNLAEDGYINIPHASKYGKFIHIKDPFWRIVEGVFDQVELHDAIAYYILMLAEDKCGLYDTEDGLVKRLNSKLESLGILALSMRNDCPVMWAHYAENHKGVVFVFDSKKEPLLASAQPVAYVSARPITTVNTVVDNLYRKGLAWAYEQEYRVLLKSSDTTVKLSEDALVGIILGMHMGKDERDQAVELASSLKSCAIFEAYADSATFSIQNRKLC